jgi:hypothetical protein
MNETFTIPAVDNLQNANKIACTLQWFIKEPISISHKLYIENDRWYITLNVTMKRRVCLCFAYRS